ncbi:MAG: hypothetical protein AB7V32_09825 [Candidatus Berkiella sp.]
MSNTIRAFCILSLCGLMGCSSVTLTDALATKQDTNKYRYMVDRNGYHYWRGSDAPDRHFQPIYYNNAGYFNSVNPKEGRYIYSHAYENYNNGYYKGGFYSNEYYHDGHFNNGYYNPGYCRGKWCHAKWMK